VSDISRKVGRIDRVLVIDPNTATAKMLATMVRGVWPAAKVYGAGDTGKAMALAAEVDPQLVFVESGGGGFDGVKFTRAFRRSDLKCRETPMIMVSGDVTAGLILAARDSGIHEFMRRPYTIGDLERRLEASCGKPRDWIEAIDYVGPDRRRFNSGEFDGPKKRRSDGSSVKVQKMNQALRIIQAAAKAVEADPVQCARALTTQCRVLIELAAGQEPYARMAQAVLSLQTHLQSGEALAKDRIEAYAAGVLKVAPEDIRPKAAA
jgi:DNA-binding response OmpR family regulator